MRKLKIVWADIAGPSSVYYLHMDAYDTQIFEWMKA
jgi:hypothetical protein